MLTADTRRRGSGLRPWKAQCLVLALVAIGGMSGGAVGVTGQADFTIDAWQTDDGLPQSSVKSIAQTPDGYLWLATFNGLARFDGVRFTVFDTSNLPGLPNNRLIQLSVDRAGALWLITEYYDLARLQNGRCRTFTAADGLPPEGVRWVEEDGQGVLWLAGQKGSLRRWQNGKFVSVPAPPELEAGPIERMVVDSEGGAWFQQQDRLFGLHNGQIVLLQGPDGQPEAVVKHVCPSRDGGLWVVTPAGLRKHRQGRWLPVVWPCPDFKSRPVDSREDLAGNLWLATYNNGLFRFSPNTGWTYLTVESGLTTLSLRSLHCDREGNVWAGTDGGGLLRIKPRLWKMITRREGLGIDAVHSVSQDQHGRIWFGGGTSKPYWLNDGVVSVAIASPLSDPMQGVWAVLAARTGATWIGTYGGKVFRFKDGALTAYGAAEGMLAGSVRALLEDRQGAIWVGGVEGLSRIDRDQVTHYSRRNGMSSDRVQTLAEDSHARLYIGTADGGLNRFQDGRFTVFTHEQGLPDDVITALYVDAEDVLWIGTHGGGLSRFQTGRFFNYRVKGGLPARGVGPMLEDNDGRLWMASDLGIIRVSRHELAEFGDGRLRSVNYVAFDRSDGLETIEVGGIQPACLKARDGTLWFGTAKGAAFVDPRQLRVNPFPPPVMIDEVRIDGEIVEEQRSESRGETSGGGWSRVTLQPSQRRVEFRFTGLSFAAPTRVRFRYRMEGFDPDWVDGGATRSASYTRLPPGNYTFHVTACNNDGVWNQVGVSLAVEVVPAFHQTWWFLLLVLAGMAGVSWALIHVRVSRLQQLARLRGRIAGDLHDEIGSNLGGIILLSELTQHVPALPTEAQTSLQEINTTAQRTASAMRDIVWFLNPDFDTLVDMVARMREFARTLLAGVDCEFVAPSELSGQSLPLEFRRNVFFTFKEILHNIVKHAAATRVSMRVEVTGRRLTLRVQDNGRGFDRAAASSGHGLRSMQQRAADLRGEFVVESEPVKGTIVTLTVMLP
ncbi:MAG: triple tyrosine motif-containing protein [Acidobacteria bacterium]|nr:triple tyrosine motif-containing protein [Acidobacteriota bacterium]